MRSITPERSASFAISQIQSIRGLLVFLMIAGIADGRGVDGPEPTPETGRRAPDAVLQGLGLTRFRSVYQLQGESEVEFRMAAVDAIFREHQGVLAQMQAIKENDAMIVELSRRRIYAVDRRRRCNIRLDSLPVRGNNLIRAAHQAAYAAWIIARDELRAIETELDERKHNSVALRDRKDLIDREEKFENDLREKVADLRREADQVVAEYQRLADLKAVRAALRASEASNDKVKLGPSDRFRAIQRDLVKAETEIRAAKPKQRAK